MTLNIRCSITIVGKNFICLFMQMTVSISLYIRQSIDFGATRIEALGCVILNIRRGISRHPLVTSQTSGGDADARRMRAARKQRSKGDRETQRVRAREREPRRHLSICPLTCISLLASPIYSLSLPLDWPVFVRGCASAPLHSCTFERPLPPRASNIDNQLRSGATRTYAAIFSSLAEYAPAHALPRFFVALNDCPERGKRKRVRGANFSSTRMDWFAIDWFDVRAWRQFVCIGHGSGARERVAAPRANERFVFNAVYL